MFKTLFNNTKSIRSRVMTVIEDRIAQAQQRFDSRCEEIDLEAQEAVEKIYQQADEGKEVLAQNLVQEILGKVI